MLQLPVAPPTYLYQCLHQKTPQLPVSSMACQQWKGLHALNDAGDQARTRRDAALPSSHVLVGRGPVSRNTLFPLSSSVSSSQRPHQERPKAGNGHTYALNPWRTWHSSHAFLFASRFSSRLNANRPSRNPHKRIQ
ncbi:hypothetical protein VDGL01_03120 [Verticillium dahliae]